MAVVFAVALGCLQVYGSVKLVSPVLAWAASGRIVLVRQAPAVGGVAPKTPYLRCWKDPAGSAIPEPRLAINGHRLPKRSRSSLDSLAEMWAEFGSTGTRPVPS